MKKATNDAVPEFKKVRDKSPKKGKKKESKADVHEGRRPTRIFLYLKLEEIQNLPWTNHKLILKLEQTKNTITKLEDRYTTDTTIDLSIFDTYNPTFAIMIEQDSIEDLNSFSNNPLIITLYEYIYILPESSASGEQEDEPGQNIEPQVEWKPLSLGYIDLLQFFCRKRADSLQATYLFPLKHMTARNTMTATRAVWQLYTLLPLLKNINFCNLAFITLESIYNARPLLSDQCTDVRVDISFQSKIQNERKEYDRTKLCSFQSFTENIIVFQNFNNKWESMKNMGILKNLDSLALHTGTKVNQSRLFRKLLCTEGVSFNFEDIQVSEDIALVCNSTHRYILTEDLVNSLEDTVAFNEQELLVEVYNNDAPDEVLLQGFMDLSIFLYPLVNAIRFAVELRPVKSITQTDASPKVKQKDKTSATRGSKRTNQSATSQPKTRTTFLILNICLLTPITDSIQPIYKPSQKMERCKMLATKSLTSTTAEVCEEMYKQFDELISMLIHHIVQKQIKTTASEKVFFCGQVGNISNKVMKLISCDFNVRFPTKTNAEFTNLMTTIYHELEERIYNVVQKCDTENLTTSCEKNPVNQKKVINFMAVIKYMYEVGNETMGKFLLDKIKQQNPNNPSLNFYLYIYNVEKHNFSEAKPYYSRPIKEKELAGEYFTQIIRIYINYMEDLSSNDIRPEAVLEKLIESLRQLTILYSADIDAYVLLYCLYKRSGYMAGMSFARWKYENVSGSCRQQLDIPISLWEIYNNNIISFKTKKGTCFYEVLILYLQLGLYKFGEIVYQEIAVENTDLEQYFMMTTIKILLKDVDKKCVTKTFPTEKLSNGQELKAYNAQINGNLDYFLGNIDKATKSYAHIVDAKIDENIDKFQMGLLRFGYNMMEMHEYSQAIKAFDKCTIAAVSLVPYFEMGKAFYRLNRLSEAEKNLAKATKYAMHVPDIWGFLALVNLKAGQNFKALECWKYAKLNPENVIDDEILQELAKIKYEDVMLYVDMPKK